MTYKDTPISQNLNGYYYYYSYKQGRFLTFDCFDNCKLSIDNEWADDDE